MLYFDAKFSPRNQTNFSQPHNISFFVTVIFDIVSFHLKNVLSTTIINRAFFKHSLISWMPFLILFYHFQTEKTSRKDIFVYGLSKGNSCARAFIWDMLIYSEANLESLSNIYVEAFLWKYLRFYDDNFLLKQFTAFSRHCTKINFFH